MKLALIFLVEATVLDDNALKRLPDNKYALYQKSFTLASLKKYIEAIDYFNKISSRYPKFKQGWFRKGIAFYKLRNYENANICYD